jgi:hypothetical protein
MLLSLFLVQAVHAAGGAVAPVLGSAGNFSILGETLISTAGATVIGNVGISPAAATFVQGFGLVACSGICQSTTSSLVTGGNVYAADFGAPTPNNMGVAIGNMLTAYNNAASSTYEGTPTATELGAGNIGGLILVPGVYKWSTGVIIPTSVTLNGMGNSNAVWVFQIAQGLDLGSGSNVILTDGAQAQNIYWQVGTQATLETTSNFSGTILAGTSIVINNGAQLHGRALAQAAVTLTGATGIVAAPTIAATPPPAPIGPTTITIISSNNPSTVGNAITFTANVFSNSGSIPNGEIITYMNGANTLGSGTTVSGLNSIIVSSLSIGTYSITAVYPGDSTFATSTSTSLSENVISSNTAPVTLPLTATISATPDVLTQFGGSLVAVSVSGGTPPYEYTEYSASPVSVFSVNTLNCKAAPYTYFIGPDVGYPSPGIDSNFSIWQVLSKSTTECIVITDANNDIYSVAKSVFVIPSTPSGSENIPAGVFYAIPITFTNYQNVSVAANTPLSVSFNAGEYVGYETSNLMNIEFFYQNGTIVPSWLEGNSLNENQSTNLYTSSNILYWIRSPSTDAFLPAYSTNVIYLGFAGNVVTSSNTLMDGITTGEAPQLSSGYADYDNGNQIFGYYDNFAGNALDGGWAANAMFSNFVTVDNGLQVTRDGFTVSTHDYLPLGNYTEALMELTSDNYGNGFVDGQVGYVQGANILNSGNCGFFGSTHNTLCADFGFSLGLGASNGQFAFYTSNSASQNTIGSLAFAANTYYVYGMGAMPGTSLFSFNGFSYVTNSSVIGNVPVPFQFSMANFQTSVLTVPWIRIRIAAPDAVMPTVTYGGVQLTSTTTTLISNGNPVTVGSSITFSTTVASSFGSVPNGELVTYMEGSNVIGTGTTLSGANSLAVSSLGIGTYSITVVYSGDANFAASASGSLPETVNAALPSGGGGGGSGGTIDAGGGGGTGLPQVKLSQNGACYTISDFAALDSESLQFSGMSYFVRLNFISPNATGVTVDNGTSYTLLPNALQTFAKTNITDYTIGFQNISYVGSFDLATVVACSTLIIPFVPANTTVKKPNGNVTSAGPEANPTVGSNSLAKTTVSGSDNLTHTSTTITAAPPSGVTSGLPSDLLIVSTVAVVAAVAGASYYGLRQRRRAKVEE